MPRRVTRTAFFFVVVVVLPYPDEVRLRRVVQLVENVRVYVVSSRGGDGRAARGAVLLQGGPDSFTSSGGHNEIVGPGVSC